MQNVLGVENGEGSLKGCFGNSFRCQALIPSCISCCTGWNVLSFSSSSSFFSIVPFKIQIALPFSLFRTIRNLKIATCLATNCWLDPFFGNFDCFAIKRRLHSRLKRTAQHQSDICYSIAIELVVALPPSFEDAHKKKETNFIFPQRRPTHWFPLGWLAG